MADDETNETDQVETDQDEEGDGAGSKGKGKLIIIIVIVVLLLAGGGAAFFLMGGGGDAPSSAGGEAVSVEGEVVDGGENAIGGIVYYDLEEFVVNLNVGSDRPSFLKMTISLELPNETQIPSVEEKMPRIRDTFQVYLRELKNEDLQGSAGMYRLREELLLRINKTVYPAKVSDILFKQILVQ
tara:strand:+ start:797 stop:1348 length:552 start_codon:yes stop_codon:yes gene_type:complete